MSKAISFNKAFDKLCDSTIGKCVIVLFVAVVCIVPTIFITGAIHRQNAIDAKESTVSCTVSSTERYRDYRVATRTSTVRWLVRTEECGTLESSDNIMNTFGPSAETAFSSIDEGSRYEFQVYGSTSKIFGTNKAFNNYHKI